MKIIRILFFPFRLVFGLMGAIFVICAVGMGADTDVKREFRDLAKYIVKG